MSNTLATGGLQSENHPYIDTSNLNRVKHSIQATGVGQVCMLYLRKSWVSQDT